MFLSGICGRANGDPPPDCDDRYIGIRAAACSSRASWHPRALCIARLFSKSCMNAETLVPSAADPAPLSILAWKLKEFRKRQRRMLAGRFQACSSTPGALAKGCFDLDLTACKPRWFQAHGSATARPRREQLSTTSPVRRGRAGQLKLTN
jgi:hypothetical protein